MLIVVCIKQVPDTNTLISIDPSSPMSLDETGFEWIMNPYDELALEEALQIKEAHKNPSDCKILLLSLGPSRVEKTLRQGLAMGADRALLLETKKTFDPKITSYILSLALKENPPHLILTGAKGIDHNHCTTSSMLAHRLKLLFLPSVVQIEKPNNPEDLYTNTWSCKMQADFDEILEAKFLLPSLISIEKGANQARYPSLLGIMQAKKKPLSIKNLSQLISHDEFEPLKNDISFHSFHYPPKPPKAHFIDGSPEEQTKKLLYLLKENEGLTLSQGKED